MRHPFMFIYNIRIIYRMPLACMVFCLLKNWQVFVLRCSQSKSIYVKKETLKKRWKKMVKTNTNLIAELIPGICLAREHQEYWEMTGKEPPASCSSFLEHGDKAASTFPDRVRLLSSSTLQGLTLLALLRGRRVITLQCSQFSFAKHPQDREFP